MSPSLEELSTSRLLLTRMRESDYPDLYRMHQDPRVMATLGGVLFTEDQTRERMGRTLAHWEQHGFGWWVARDPETGAFVGRGGLRRGNYGSDKVEVEVAYGLMPEFWGRGLAAELAAESVRVGFELLGLSELICFTEPTNVRSRRVMEKVGFVYERDGDWANRPHVFYRLTAEQWREKTAIPEETRP
jgi:RimJ/RimL family protein N-acetyltransferase